MATWPTCPVVLLEGHSEQHAQIAERSEMDRGVPKQRRTQSDVVVTLPLNLLFRTDADANSFEDWYYASTGAAAGASSFDWTHPRTGVLYQARVVANSLGPLTPLGRGISRRTIQIEYLKALTL